MNKNLLAAAVAAAMFAPAVASADVTVYGRAQVEYNVEDYDGQDSVQSVDDAAGQSRIGFKFKEKLGGGLTAFGKAEFKIDPADNNDSGTGGSAGDKGVGGTGNEGSNNAAGITSALGQRDVFVGIKGSWGAISAGSHHAPYKVAGGVKWDPFNATHLQARRAGGMTGGTGLGGHNGFMRNSIQYTSPNVNGFKVAFAISPDETNAGATENVTNGDNDYSLSVQYKNGPWHAIFAHNRNNNPSTVAAGDETLTKAGLKWKNGPWALTGQYESVSDSDRTASGGAPGIGAGGAAYRVSTGSDGKVLFLNAQYKAGNNIFVASYGNTDVDVNGGNDYEHDYWALGVIHKFSKKTRIFGGYTETDGDADAGGTGANDRQAWSVGIRKDF